MIFPQFITITSDEHVAFSHLSVLEYLTCERVNVAFRVQESAAHLLMLDSCLSYIPTAVEQSDDTSNKTNEFYLLKYACDFWPAHARATFTNKVPTSHTDELFCNLFANQGLAYVQHLKIATFPERLYEYGDFASPAWFMSYHDLSRGLELLYKGTGNDMMDPGLNEIFRGYTALHFSSIAGWDEVSAVLLRLGADFRIKEEQEGATPLHLAVQSANEQIANFLLDAGANPLDIDFDGRNALHRAAWTGQCGIVELVLSRLPSTALEIKDDLGFTALHWAIKSELFHRKYGGDVIKLLMKHGANPETESYAGTRPIVEAYLYNNSDVMRLLKGGGDRTSKALFARLDVRQPFMWLSPDPRQSSSGVQWEHV